MQTPTPTPTSILTRWPRWPRWNFGRLGALAALLLVLALAGLAWGEYLGWPLLAGPIERWGSARLGRALQLQALPADEGHSQPAAPRLQIRFIGGLRAQVGQLSLAAPAWGQAPTLLQIQGLDVTLHYADLWRAWRGQGLHVHSLQARRVDADLERGPDGRASWTTANAAAPLPSFGRLVLQDGQLRLRDTVMGVDALAHWALTALTNAPGSPAARAASLAASAASPGASAAPAPPAAYALRASASGQYQHRPLKIELQASLDSPADGADAVAAAGAAPALLDLQAVVGRARLDFKGGLDHALAAAGAKNAAALDGLWGRYTLQGPSLAAVGDPLGVTLPTTRAFRSQGRLRKAGVVWQVVVDDATIGSSRLRGAFSFDRSRAVPLLAGRLSGPRLLLADLGPAVGVVPAADVGTTTPPRPGKVLPDRPFDLAALRVMDANVLINIDELDLNTPRLQPLRPLQAHLQLVGGVLDIGALDARAGPGRLRGSLQLDGRSAQAALRTDLRWDGLRLEQWIHQARAGNQPPFVSGALQGWARLQGQGRSTAEILARLNGQVRADLRDGRVSHLAIEAAGLDLAESLGVLLKGDDALPVPCAMADLVAEHGVFRARTLVLDSTDSTLWVDGSISLASEALDLRVIVSPRDFSPLALRTPLRLRGSLGQPQVSIEASRLAGRLGLSALLALVNPLAALLPLLDGGDPALAAHDASGCAGLARRAQGRSKAVVLAPR